MQIVKALRVGPCGGLLMTVQAGLAVEQKLTIANNTFTYQGDGNQCVHLVAHDTSFTGNTLNVKGSAIGVRGEGPPPQSLTITNNTLSMGTGTDIMIASARRRLDRHREQDYRLGGSRDLRSLARQAERREACDLREHHQGLPRGVVHRSGPPSRRYSVGQ